MLAHNVSVEADRFWSSRCWFWQDKVERSKQPRGRRQRCEEPLVLTGHGISLRVDAGTLKIADGFTHHPQKQHTYRFFRGDLDLPPRIIIADGSGNVSLDAISWLSEQGVALLRLNWHGDVICVTGNSSFAANPYKVEWQRETRDDPRRRMGFCVDLISRKIDATIRTLEKSVPRSAAWEKAVSTHYATLTQLEEKPPTSVEELRSIEGNAAAAYFRSWAAMPLIWKQKLRQPIPDHWCKIGARPTDLFTSGNRHARHPVNAILNYAYTVLQSELMIDLVAQGYDPSIGIMHSRQTSSTCFIFDVMELHRAAVDGRILCFLSEEKLDPADFHIRSDGVCRLNPHLARYVAQTVATITSSLSRKS